MKKLLLTWLVACLAGSCLARADEASASVTFVGRHYEGIIAQVDASSRTGAIATRFGGRTLAFRVGDDTRIWKTERMSLKNLQVGAPVMIVGQTTKTDDLIEPFLIDMLPALPPDNGARAGVSGKRKVAIFGTITAINDDRINGSMTVVDRSGKNMTIALKGYRPLIGRTVLGDFADLALGAPVKVDGKMSSSTMVASRIVLKFSLHARKSGIMRGEMETSAPVAAVSPATAGPSVSEEDFGIFDLL